MKRNFLEKSLILSIILAVAVPCLADGFGNKGMKISEIDGSPAGWPKIFKFSNGTITDNLDNTYTYLPDLSSVVPYSGATDDVDLGGYNITAANLNVSDWDTAYGWGDHSIEGYLKNVIEDTTPQLGGDLDGQAFNVTTTGIGTFGKVKSGIYYPAADSTTAIQFNKADSTTNVFNIDTTNLHVSLPNDNQYLKFGGGYDAGITYDGTDMVFNSRLVGTGKFKLQGETEIYQPADNKGFKVYGYNDHSAKYLEAFLDNVGTAHINATSAWLFEVNTIDGIAIGSTIINSYLNHQFKVSATMDGDNIPILFGAADDASIKYDGTNLVINTALVAPSDLDITCGANKTIELQNTVVDDLQFPITIGKIPGALYPNWETFTTNTSAYAFGINEYIDTQANELPHWWAQGTTGNVHLHFTIKTAQSTGSNRFAKFIVIVIYADTNEAWVETSLTAEATIPTGSAALTNFYLDMGDITLTNYLIGAQVACRVQRIAATGGTEYADDVFITQVGMHLEKDTMGSRQETVK